MKNLTHPDIGRMLQRELQARRTTHPVATKRDPKLWKVSQQFEAIFLQQILEAMHKTVPQSGFIPTGFSEQVHESMFDQAVASAISQHSDLGIASAIYRQLAHIGQTQAKAAAADTVNSKVAAPTPPHAPGESDGTD